MTNDGTFIADTLESILVGMAESLREAQEELATAAPLDNYGRPAAQYRIPHLDFEVGFKMETDTSSAQGMKILLGAKTNKTTDVTSSISGRFVAVPPGEGMPIPVLDLRVDGTGNTRDIVVQATTSAGEILVNAQIEVNVDKAASVAFSQEAGVAAVRLDGQVMLSQAVLVTDGAGIGRTTLTFGNALQRAGVVVLTAELGGEQARALTGKGI